MTTRAKENQRGAAIKKSVLERAYALPSYDLIRGAPQLAVALNARGARDFDAPIMDVNAFAWHEIETDQAAAQSFRWAWLCLLERTAKTEKKWLLVSATQVITRATRHLRGTPNIDARDHRVAALYDTFATVVPGNGPENWLIHDVRIGRRSQFIQNSPISGAEFATNRRSNDLSIEAVQANMDVELIVEYVGPQKSCAPFYASLVGRQLEEPTGSEILPLSNIITGVIAPGTRLNVTTRAHAAFRPSRLMIMGTPPRPDTAVSLHATVEAALLAADDFLRPDLCAWLGGYLDNKGHFVGTRARY